MVAPRTLRRWLWRVDAVLAVLVVAVGAWAAVTLTAPVAMPSFEIPPHDEKSETRPAGRSAEGLEGILRLLARYQSGSPPRNAESASPADQSTRLPLRALRVTIPVWLGDQPLAVILRSKDPAHPECHTLAVGESDGDLTLEKVVRDREETRVTVRRGEETFTFDLPRRASIDRVVREVPRRDAGLADGSEHRTPGTDAARDIKVVPFFGDEGHAIGMRITGLRPDGWARRMGAIPGDVILAVDGREVPDLVTLRAAIAGGREPGMLRVERREGPASQVLTLGGATSGS